MEKGQVFENRYKIIKLLKNRSSYQVYKVLDKNNRKKISLKLFSKSSLQFSIEKESLSILSSVPGIPKLIGFDSSTQHNYLAYELLGDSLQELYSNRRFSLGCVLEISSQLLTILELLHSYSFIHRDLKPENIYRGSRGTDKKTKIYLGNFGICKRYRDPISKVHLRYSEYSGINGNLLFCSANANIGIEQSRRDDIESWFYIILFFIKGSLPWEIQAKNESTVAVKNLKINTSIETLCEKTPVGFQAIFSYIKMLKYNEKPNYDYLKGVLMNIAGNKIKLELDWSFKNYSASSLMVQKNKEKEKRSKSEIFSEDDFKMINNETKERNNSFNLNENERRQKKTIICEYPEFKSRKVTIKIVLNS